MTMGKAFGAILVSSLLLALTFGAGGQVRAQTSSDEAAKFVESLRTEVVTLLDETKIQAPEERRTALRDLVRRGFNLELTSQFVLGKHWNRATPEQQTQFQELFTEYLLNSYARHLGSYRIETLSIVASHPVGGKDVLVETSIEGTDGAANPIWRVRAAAGLYKIIDISIGGVSLALSQRREFAAVIGRGGLDGLLNMLREKLAAQAKAAQLGSTRGDMRISLFASILASPSANKIGILLARR